MKKQHIQLLNKQIDKLNAADFDLEAWKVATQLLLGQLFGKYDEKTITIRDLKIDYSSTMLRDSNSNYQPMETCKRKGRAVLELAIDQLNVEVSGKDNDDLNALHGIQEEKELDEHLRKLKKDQLIDLIKQALGK